MRKDLRFHNNMLIIGYTEILTWNYPSNKVNLFTRQQSRGSLHQLVIGHQIVHKRRISKLYILKHPVF